MGWLANVQLVMCVCVLLYDLCTYAAIVISIATAILELRSPNYCRAMAIISSLTGITAAAADHPRSRGSFEILGSTVTHMAVFDRKGDHVMSTPMHARCIPEAHPDAYPDAVITLM